MKKGVVKIFIQGFLGFATLYTHKKFYSPASSGIAMKRLPIHEVADAEALNSSRNSI